MDQQDAQEYLEFLFEYLNTELEYVKGKRNGRKEKKRERESERE